MCRTVSLLIILISLIALHGLVELNKIVSFKSAAHGLIHEKSPQSLLLCFLNAFYIVTFESKLPQIWIPHVTNELEL